MTRAESYRRLGEATVAGAGLTGAVALRACVGVLVGDRNPTGGPPFPTDTRSGSWLREAVDLLGSPRLLVANLHLPTRMFPEQVEPLFRLNVDLLAVLRHEPQLRVVALGEEVRIALESQGIAALGVCHPAWHRRFRRAERPAGYAARLASALGLPASLVPQ